MSDVEVRESHSLGADAAKKALVPFEADIAKYGMSIAWNGLQGDLKGTGASGSVVVTDSQVTVTVKLGMIAKMAGVKPDKLRDSITKRLRSALAGSASGGTPA